MPSRALLDALPVPTILLDGTRSDTAVIAAANAASAEVLGELTAPGTPLAQLLRRHGLYRPDRQTPLPWAELPAVRALDGGETVRRLEIHLLRSDGSWRVLLADAAPLRADGQITGAVTLFQDITELGQTARRLAAQYAVSRTLSEAADLSEAGPRILAAIGAELGWSYGALWVLDEDGKALRCAGTWHAPGLEFAEFEAATRQTTLEPGRGLPGRVWSTGQPVWISDVTRDANFPRRLAAVLEGVCSGLGFPIVLAGEVLGVFEVFSRETREPDPDLIQTMASLGGQIGQFIERRRAEEALHEARRQAENAYHRERQIAVQFQGALLPREPLHMAGYAVAVAYRPALHEADVGGDFYNLFQIDEQRVGIVVGDIGGKGLAAAVIAAWMQHAIVTLAIGERALPDTVLRDIRRTIHLFKEPDRLATVFVGILEPETGRLSYSSAGHEAALVWRSATKQVEELAPDGPAIISIPIDVQDWTRHTTLDPGDLLFLYTDGLPDARAGRGSPPLGHERVQDLLAEHHAEAPAEIIRAMCGTATRHARNRLPDDIALMVIRRLEMGGASPSWAYVEHDDYVVACGTEDPGCRCQSLS